MEIRVEQGNIAESDVDLIVVNLFAGVTAPGGATGAIDRALNGAISRLIAQGDFSGEAETTALLYARVNEGAAGDEAADEGGLRAPRTLIVGLGSSENFGIGEIRRAAAVAAQAAAKLKGVKSMATIVHGAGIAGHDASAAAQEVALGTILASYRAKQYGREAGEAGLESCTVVEYNAAKLEDVSRGVTRGEAIGRAVCRARDLVNEPANVLTPVEMAARARAMAAEVGLGCTILDEAAMEEAGMGILLAVSQGSVNPAQFVILEHAPEGETEAPLLFVGKGITFDTGGISLKRTGGMWAMKDDMGGAAAVIGAMEAIGRLGVPRRVIGITPCVENMPDGDAFRPGDIVTGMTGKTAEIISTDAEGRLILADALAYAARYEPAAVVDLATLTGAISTALGMHIRAGLFSNDSSLEGRLMAAADYSGEGLWPFPMDAAYEKPIKSDMAEVKNSAGRAGISSSAKFIEHFTEGYPWAHLDIANMVLADSRINAETPKGATGYGVRLLVALAEAEAAAS
jgi:leucyl aminopeptidase